MYFSKSYTLGLIFILTCAIIWAGASVLIQYIYQDLNFKSPFLVTYLANSLLVFYLPLWQLWILLGVVKPTVKLSSVESESDNEDIRLNSCFESQAFNDNRIDQSNLNTKDNSTSDSVSSHREVIKIAMVISPVWFLANCLYNYSLLMTSNSSSTIISNLSASFTLAFSWYMGLEQITGSKLAGIVVCFAGAVTVGLQDSASGDVHQQTILGDVVALLAAVGYGLYTTMLRYQIRDDESVSMQLLLGYIGLFNAILLSPVLLVLFLLGMANLNHLTGAIFGFIVLNGFADNVFSDYLWARAVVLTSPTVATIGMSITIPLAMISDFLINHKVPSGISFLGAFLVVVGFLLVNIPKPLQDDVVEYFQNLFGQRRGRDHIPIGGYSPVDTK